MMNLFYYTLLFMMCAHMSIIASNTNGSKDYTTWKFGSGDAIKISTVPDSGFPDGIYVVNEDGYVDLPIVGQININKMGKDSFDLLIKEAYIVYLRGPNIHTLRLIRISLLGGFHKSGLYWINPETTLWNAIYMAGGTLREDGIKKLKWERDGKIVKKSLEKDFQSGKSLEKLGFLSGDIITVTSSQKLSTWETFLRNIVPLLNLAISAFAVAAVIRN